MNLFPTVSDLAPGQEYIFEVRAYEDQLIGPVNPVQVKTEGQPLLPVESLEAVLMDVKTTVNLSWNKPPYELEKV